MPVYYNKAKGTWLVRISIHGKETYAGVYPTELDATMAMHERIALEKAKDAEGPEMYSQAWYEKTSAEQVQRFSKKYN